MQKIMGKFDVFELPDRGLIIGATNPELDALSREQILSLIGRKIGIHKADGSRLEVGVAGIDVSASFAGHKNVMIRLAEGIEADEVRAGVKVYGLA